MSVSPAKTSIAIAVIFERGKVISRVGSGQKKSFHINGYAHRLPRIRHTQLGYHRGRLRTRGKSSKNGNR